MFINIGGVRINTSQITSYEPVSWIEPDGETEFNALAINVGEEDSSKVFYIECPNKEKAVEVAEYFDTFMSGEKRPPSIKKDIKKYISNHIFQDHEKDGEPEDKDNPDQ